jgi:glutathione S-transferase
MSFKHIINVCSSTIVSSLYNWRGTVGSRKVKLPEEGLILFDRESCPECRLVRQALTELNLDVLIYPCPEEGDRHLRSLQEVSGAEQIPFLFDQNTAEKLTGSEAILAYLYNEYAKKAVPEKFQLGRFDHIKDSLSDFLRAGAGKTASSSKQAEQSLILYSFESSPFSRPVREKLCELQLPYQLINLGKQQKADMGPAVFRFHTGPYVPVSGSKREDFLKRHDQVMVPYLFDPNTGQGLFQSEQILEYLTETYQLTH